MESESANWVADKDCKYCKGTGWMWVMVGGEPEKDMCDCVHREGEENV